MVFPPLPTTNKCALFRKAPSPPRLQHIKHCFAEALSAREVSQGNPHMMFCKHPWRGTKCLSGTNVTKDIPSPTQEATGGIPPAPFRGTSDRQEEPGQGAPKPPSYITWGIGYFWGGARPSQGLLLALRSGNTPGKFRGSNGMLEIKPGWSRARQTPSPPWTLPWGV